MGGSVSLVVTRGPIEGARFEFREADLFFIGRGEECHARLPEGDTSVSRYHFVLELAPPEARIRDLGSRNGTFVNGTKIGGREPDDTPEQARARARAQEGVILRDRDEIEIGDTSLTCAIEAPSAPAVDIGAPADPEAFDARVAEAAGYELGRLLGEGAMGVVHLARRRADGETFALKIIRPERVVDEASRKLCQREIDVMRSVQHPNLLGITDHGVVGNAFWFALDFCPGGNLEDLRLRHGGRVPIPEAAHYVLQALAGLEHLHAQGYVHRDLKPENVLLSAPEGGIARVADFGLAKSFQRAAISTITSTGVLGGTPAYMPKEQVIDFKRVGPTADVYAMGATLYHLVTGDIPIEFGTVSHPALAILTGEIVPTRDRDPSVPPDVAAVIDHAIAKEPEQRFQTAGAFAEALRSVG